MNHLYSCMLLQFSFQMLMLTMKQSCTLEHIVFFMLCFTSVFAYSPNMIDSYIVPKWCFTGMVLLAGCIILSIKHICSKILKWNTVDCGHIISFICMFQTIYGTIQWIQQLFSHENCYITGSFDNPAGYAACLCIGFPYILQYLHTAKERRKLIISGFSIFLIVLTLFFSGSRAGIIGSLAVAIAFLFKRIYILKKGKNILIVGISLILLLIGSYFLKKDSADGRLLIWKCSWEMIKDSPIYGHGTGSFLKHYMNYQANYFDKHSDSQFAMLADNVQHPFSEYFSIILNFGLIGGVLLLIVMILLFRVYNKNSDQTNDTAILSLLGIAVFAAFSYPFTYPFTWIIGLYNICIILKRILMWRNPLVSCRLAYGLVFIFCTISAFSLYQRTKGEYLWYEAYKNKQLFRYELLMSVLGNDPYFLYNYAVELYNANRTTESREIALLCRKQWANYDLELLLGDIYMKKSEFALAESHYKQAALMCPCRFIPLYQLFNLYRKNGNKDKAYFVAQQIDRKPVKISSATVRQIKYKIKHYLQ